MKSDSVLTHPIGKDDMQGCFLRWIFLPKCYISVPSWKDVFKEFRSVTLETNVFKLVFRIWEWRQQGHCE